VLKGKSNASKQIRDDLKGIPAGKKKVCSDRKNGCRRKTWEFKEQPRKKGAKASRGRVGKKARGKKG